MRSPSATLLLLPRTKSVGFRVGAMLTLLLGWAATPSPAAAPASYTNVVLIMADDFGYECVGINGSDSYKTPHLNQLAANGVRFTRCHVQPLCTPTRLELMTGLSNVRNYHDFGLLPESQRTFAHLFRDAGYATGICGKWQLGHKPGLPQHFGFNEALLWQHTRRPPRYANPGLERNDVEEDYSGGEYGPTLINDFACDFISRHKSEPFLLYYPMILTHDPFQPTPDSPDWDPTTTGEKARRHLRHFGKMVAYADAMVGRLLARLDAEGIREQTLVIFLGDNGTHRTVTSRFQGADYPGGKGLTTQRGTHVPLIVSWPAVIDEPAVCENLVTTVDFLPTIAAAAGLQPFDGIDGQSFLPQLKGEAGSPREWIYSWYSPRIPAKGPRKISESVFDGRFKRYRSGELYDVVADPEEQQPVDETALDADATTAAARLAAALTSFDGARPEHLGPQQPTAP
jgi:arylsulfatase A